MHHVTLERDHDAHPNDVRKGFDNCYQVVAHCESTNEAQQVGKILSERFGPLNGFDSDPDSVEEWWEAESAVILERSDWSATLEAVIEVASMEECGDHIDRIRARELRAIVARIRQQVDTTVPCELRREKSTDGGAE